MKPHGRRSGVRTADLFADRGPAADALPPAVLRVEPSARIGGQSPRPLWHAVVFPDFGEMSNVSTLLPQLCLSAQQFTPLVSIEMPNALLLEIKGSIALFGSLTVLRAAIEAAWSRFSLRAHSATAPTALAALWFARAGKPVCIEDSSQLAGELAQLPIACTSWDLSWLKTLRAMGVTRVGELLRLPRAGVARRLSPAAVRDLDIALARQAAPRRAHVPLERFCERCDFEAEIETAVYLRAALEPLIERCAQFLRVRQAGVQALQLQLRHRLLPMTRLRLGLASCTGESHRLAKVLDEKLHRLALRAPVRSMELKSGPLQPLSAESLDAFAGLRTGDLRISEAAPQLVERLRARLGEAAVYGVMPVPEHRPEAAWQRVHELRLTAVARVAELRTTADVQATGAQATGTACGMPRPVWLLNEPMLLSSTLLQLQREGLILEQGPERIESGWWDGKGVARDYYAARQAHGARWWIFQERRTRRWFLHGVFA